MDTISIKYRPVSWLPFNRSITGIFPHEYAELGTHQFLALTNLMSGNTTENEFISKMTGIPAKLIKNVAPFLVYKLMNLLTGFNSEKPHNGFIIKTIKARRTLFYAPNTKLKGMTFGQFIFAESLYETWTKSKTKTDLCRFVASLYLPTQQPFNENNIDKYHSCFLKVKPEICEAVAINWKIVTQWLGDAYPLVFMKGEDNVPGQKATSSGWIKIFDSIVGDNITEANRYAELPVNNVLRYMTAKIKQDMKRKK